MIIGIDASRANKDQRTGTEWYSYFVIEELKKLPPPRPSATPPSLFAKASEDRRAGGENIRFILYSRETLEGDLARLPPNFESRVLAWPPKFLWTQIRLSWEMLVRPPDILFVPAHTLPIIGRIKRVVTIHDVGFRVYPELYSWVDILYHRFSVWFASRFAYKIICISEFTKSELIKYYHTDPKKISVIPLGVNTLQNITPLPPLTLRGGTNQHAPPFKISGGEGEILTPFLLFIGRLEKKKNILGIIKAFEVARQKIPKLRLVLAGTPGHGFEKIEKYLAENRLWEAVKVLGYITGVEKERLYGNAFAFMFPTFYEGFGLPILEAQGRGCPVITSRFGAAAEVAGDSALLVDPAESGEIAKAVIALGEPGFRSELVRKGRENCKKYSWENTAKQTLEVLTGF